MFRFNTRYGHRSALCRYAGIPDAPIPFIIPHGIYKQTGIIGREREHPEFPVLAYPEYRDKVYTKAGYTVVPCASPFLYALALQPATRPETGTLFVFGHSTPGVALDTEMAPLLAALSDLPGPVTVCLHPHDDTSAMRDAFAGFECVCAGGYKERDFLLNTIDLFSANRYVATNMTGTNALYAFACERPVWLIGKRPVLRLRNGTTISEPFDHEVGIIAACSERHEDVTDAQRALARYFLRADALLPPEALADLLTKGTT